MLAAFDRPILVSLSASPLAPHLPADTVLSRGTTLRHRREAPFNDTDDTPSLVPDLVPTRAPTGPPAKVDSPVPPAAPPLAPTLTALFPPPLQPYVETTLTRLANPLGELAAALATHTGLSPPAALATLLCALALPLAMWSYMSKKPALSPFASMNKGTPDVTDEDYSYITSQDLENHNGPPEDDVLLLRHRDRTEEARFPAYSIGDGKLKVHDIRDRVALMLDIPPAGIRLFYKGRQLKEPGALARDYGVKNMSEILAMVRERPGDEGSGEDIVVAEEGSSRGSSSVGDKPKKRKGKGRKPKKKAPRDDGPSDPAFPEREGKLDQLDEIAAHYGTIEGRCLQFTRDPPEDPGKREDEHRALSETILHHVILKLDGVEPDGDEVVRTRRKGLVKQMQGVLEGLDAAKAS